MIKCMDMDSSYGLMGKVIKENIFKIKNKEKVDLIMEMDHIIKEIGGKEDNMEKESLDLKMGKSIKEDINMDNLKYEIKTVLFYL